MTDIIDDIKKAFEYLKEEVERPREPTITIHNPKCRCIVTHNINDCNCCGIVSSLKS